MTPNDVFLVVIWFVGLIGTGIAMYRVRKQVRASSQLQLDKASFESAKTVIDLVNDQLDELREELKRVQGDLKALRAREGKLLHRIQVLEATLIRNGITVPPSLVD